MEISYKTIVEYLCSEDCTEKKDDNNFTTKKNIMVSSDNFELSKLLNNVSKKTFYRYGVTRYNDDQDNISLLTSILTLLDKSFITMDKKEEISYIESFLKQIRDTIINSFNFELSNKFEKQILLDRLDSNTFNDGLLLQALSQIMDINFLIFDYYENKIKCVFKGDYMNPWKVTLFLAKHEINWEPLFCDKKIFSYNDYFLKKILTSEEILYYNQDYLDKTYCLMDNIEVLIDEKAEEELQTIEPQTIEPQTNEPQTNEPQTDDCESFLTPFEDLKNMKLNKTKLKNLKKDDIYDLISKLSLNIPKNSTKQNMIEALIPYI